MPAKSTSNRLDTAVPKPPQADRLRDGEKKALELGEEAEHSHGQARENLQKEAKKVAGERTR